MAVPAGLKFDTTFVPEHGKLVEVAPGMARLTAPNAGPYTFTGTNTYLVGDSRIAIIDPGPKNEAHLEALTEAIGGRKVEAVALTHTHADHAGLARIVQNRVDAPLLFEGGYRPMRALPRLEMDPLRWSHIVMDPDFVLQDTDAIQLDGAALTVVTTPGHTANHICLAVEGAGYLLTGDHIMGWSSTLVADPDGAMGTYLASLDKLQGLAEGRYLPGHGGEIADGKGYAAALKAHRLAREAQILASVAGGATTARAIVAKVYPALDRKTRWAALLTTRAHLFHLLEAGRVRRVRQGWMGIGERWRPSTFNYDLGH